MNKEQCEQDVIYFTEKYFGIKLTMWQKLLLRNIHKMKYPIIYNRLSNDKEVNKMIRRYRYECGNND